MMVVLTKLNGVLLLQTVLLAIIKATFSFNLSIEIWDQLMSLLSSVNSYSDVVDKWIVSAASSTSLSK